MSLKASALGVLLTTSLLGSFPREDGALPEGIEIRHQARSLHPGEVVLLTVQAASPLSDLEATAFENRQAAFPTGDGRVWRCLVGIDLSVEPGTYPVRVEGSGPAGRRLEASYNLEVKPKQFPTRRITVEDRYVNPPREVLDRIARESRLTAEIFATFTPEPLWEGPFLRPVSGPATSSFGRRSIINDQPRSPHGGTDFRAAEGTPVKAPNGGRVTLATELYYAGNTVILDHGQGLFSYFAHLSQMDVREGQTVRPGDVVGRVGATGRVTGPHLHWTVRLGGARVDPIALMEVLETTHSP